MKTNDFKSLVKQKMQEQNLSSRELATLIGSTEENINSFLNKEGSFSPIKQVLIAEYLHINYEVEGET